MRKAHEVSERQLRVVIRPVKMEHSGGIDERIAARTQQCEVGTAGGHLQLADRPLSAVDELHGTNVLLIWHAHDKRAPLPAARKELWCRGRGGERLAAIVD